MSSSERHKVAQIGASLTVQSTRASPSLSTLQAMRPRVSPKSPKMPESPQGPVASSPASQRPPAVVTARATNRSQRYRRAAASSQRL